jgi:hypothetical protein
MILPNADSLIVAEEKVVNYLLNPEHPDGAPKAQFFRMLGFETEQWKILATGLRDVGRSSPVVKDVSSPHGHKYIVDGELVGPNGTVAWVRTVWIIDRGEQTPRLVTAYPAMRSH